MCGNSSAERKPMALATLKPITIPGESIPKLGRLMTVQHSLRRYKVKKAFLKR